MESIEAFRTNKGSRYFIMQDKTWFRRSYRRFVDSGLIYLGSIDVAENSAFYEDLENYRFDDVTNVQTMPFRAWRS